MDFFDEFQEQGISFLTEQIEAHQQYIHKLKLLQSAVKPFLTSMKESELKARQQFYNDIAQLSHLFGHCSCELFSDFDREDFTIPLEDVPDEKIQLLIGNEYILQFTNEKELYQEFIKNPLKYKKHTFNQAGTLKNSPHVRAAVSRFFYPMLKLSGLGLSTSIEHCLEYCSFYIKEKEEIIKSIPAKINFLKIQPTNKLVVFRYEYDEPEAIKNKKMHWIETYNMTLCDPDDAVIMNNFGCDGIEIVFRNPMPILTYHEKNTGWLPINYFIFQMERYKK